MQHKDPRRSFRFARFALFFSVKLRGEKGAETSWTRLAFRRSMLATCDAGRDSNVAPTTPVESRRTPEP